MEAPGAGGEMAAAALRAAKRALRGELRQRLRALGAAEKQRQSRLLGRKVIGHPKYQESKRIAIFLSMPDEIQTEEIIKDIFKQGKECFIPRYKPHSNHMDMLKLSSAEDISSLTLTSWNILQPSDDDSVREEALAGAPEELCDGCFDPILLMKPLPLVHPPHPAGHWLHLRLKLINRSFSHKLLLFKPLSVALPLVFWKHVTFCQAIRITLVPSLLSFLRKGCPGDRAVNCIPAPS
ncbi:5-formyltetrahydrofolate cyclo-ligase isoform X1 [Ciconia boyciana]|uniref:5-formyltetrahydrofolate cyclo-ligase isoform X1 n=1 Tax=Ciconia boyciana TaxID=52775 RepID=UPI003BA361E5